MWLVGGPRTGSTWLLELLAYPLVASPDWPAGSKRRPGGSGVRPRAVPINEPYLGMHLAPVAEVGDRLLRVFTAADIRAHDPSYFFDERWGEAWRPQLRHLVLSRLGAQAEAARREHGVDAPLVVVKEPNGTEGAPVLTAALPRSRLLFLLRDGRDVLDSLLDAVSSGGWLAGGAVDERVDSAEARVAFVRREALLWTFRVGAVQRAMANLPEGASLTVRYEDLRADTEAAMRGVWDWLGAGIGDAAIAEAAAATAFDHYPAEAKGRGKPLRFATPGHWREGLAAAEQDATRAIMGEKLAQLGYAA